MGSYKKGDVVYYATGNGKRRRATVIAVVRLDGYNHEHYIVSTPTGVEPLLEIRSWETLSDKSVGPLNWAKYK